MAEIAAGLMVVGILWLFTHGLDLANGLLPSPAEGIVIALGFIFAGGIVHLWTLRRRLTRRAVVPSTEELAEQREQIWEDAREQIERRGQLMERQNALIKRMSREEGTLKKELARTREQLETRDVMATVHKEALEAVRPKLDWANSLIDRERGSGAYMRLPGERIALTNASHLDDLEPYFEIVINFDYRGTGHVIVGERCSGTLGWDGRQFEREPKVMIGMNALPPFESDGPTEGLLRLRQYVGPDLRDYMKTFFEREPRDVEFWIQKFSISLRIDAFDGETLFDGGLLPGDYLNVNVKYA